MTALVRTYIERNVSGTWSDISAYVVNDIEIEYLIPSNEETDKLASVGQAKLVMNNKDGLFSPSAVFQRGTPIRVRTAYDGTTKTRFLGTILEIDPDTLEWGDQFVRATVVDWMNFAVEQPLIVPQMMTGTTANEAVVRLLSLMDKQPESVTYYDGRETFDFVFDAVKKETKTYSELNKLAMSEFAPIYLRAGNVLVVESADTRHGQRELTQVPRAPIQLDALLADPNGYSIICADVTGTSAKYAILIDEMITPNFVSGTYRHMDIELKNGDMLNNRVLVRAYPARYDASNVLLYQLDVGALTLWTYQTKTIKGTWANPNGGGPINALTTSFPPMITGTNYTFFDEFGVDRSTQLQITERYGTEGFEHTIFNNGLAGSLTRFNIYGKGIYPYNPVEALVSHTGSVASYGIAQLTIDQKYQDTLNSALPIIDYILDRDKEPHNDVKSTTFEASSHPDLMQASQYIDTGDLVWVKNVKPSVDTYCYVQGKKTIISPAGWVTEKWYLKETDTLRKGLTPIALRFSGETGSKNAVSFGKHPKHGSGGQHTWTGWFYMIAPITSAPIMSKTNTAISGNNSNDIFIVSGAKQFLVRRAFENGGTVNAGVWASATGTLTGLENAWHHVAMAHDDRSPGNDPLLYLDGSLLTLNEADTPEGEALDYSNAELIIGNLNVVGAQLSYNFRGYFKDIRIYDRLLSASEVMTLATNQNNYLLVPDGLVFQAPAVRTEDYGNLTGTALYPTNKVLDNMYGAVGTPNWNFPSGTAWAVKAYDPNF